jgi:hypothetical protein
MWMCEIEMNWLHLVSAVEHSNSRMWATVSNTCMSVHWSRKTHMHNFAALEGMLKDVIITYMLGFCCRNCLDSEFFKMQLSIWLSPAFAKYMYHYWKHHHWCGCGHCKAWTHLTLILLTWNIGWAPNNARKWQMEFNLVFKGLICLLLFLSSSCLCYCELKHSTNMCDAFFDLACFE